LTAVTHRTHIGRYRVLSRLGSGGMGEVFLAEDPTLGRSVALKVLSSDHGPGSDGVRRFLREARLAAALSHPNIAQIFEIGDADDLHFIAMEYVEGQTLAARVEAGPLPTGQVVDIAMQLFDALDEAHAHGIVHRDLKPANIVLTPRGRVKVLDFGIATLALTHSVALAAATEVATSPGVVIGTFPYMSPEQALGRPVDSRSDLFSAGSLVYELITGRQPFTAATIPETLDRIVHAEPETIRRLNPGALVELERIVRKALEKDAARRYQTARDVLVDLTNLRRDGDSDPVNRSTLKRSPRTSATVIASLAVLPLTVTTADAAADYLADGITESVIHALSQLPKLKVMARSTVFRYKGRDVDPSAIGCDLGVRAVLLGRLQSIGGRLIVRAELVDTADGSHLWGGQFQRQLEDMLTLPEDLAREIVDQLRLRLSRDDRRRLRKRHTESVVAYEAYLRGRFQLAKRTLEGCTRAIECFEQATLHDPRFAMAYAGLADAYTLLGGAAFGKSPDEAMARARRAAEQALRLDEHLAEAHAAIAFVRFRLDWDWPAAEASFTRACELNPGYAPAHHSYALFLTALGRGDAAIAEIRRAAELDPLSLIISTAHGRVLHFNRQFEAAVAHFKRAIEMDAQFIQAHFDLGMTYVALGRYQDAIAELEPYLDPADGRSVMLATLGHAYGRLGRVERAREILDELNRRAADGRVSFAEPGYVLIGLGEIDEAVTAFERACNARSGVVIFLKVEPMVDPLRSQPRFHALLERMRLA
jgi:serine/threonine protein kinase/tetratricopeptide (TPR) repeat protein